MAVVEMSKIRLLGLISEKEKILKCLHRIECVELCDTKELPNTIFNENLEDDIYTQKLEKFNRAIELLSYKINASKKEEYYPKDNSEFLKNFFVSYENFENINSKSEKLEQEVEKIFSFQEQINSIKQEIIKEKTYLTQLKPYLSLQNKFTDFINTKYTYNQIGLIKQDAISKLDNIKNDFELSEIIELSNEAPIILVVSYVDEQEKLYQRLNEIGFVKCTFNIDKKPIDEYNDTLNKIKDLENKILDIEKSICDQSSYLKDLKIYSDYLLFNIEKNQRYSKFYFTENTFILEGFLPKEKQEYVENKLSKLSDKIITEFYAPDKDEVIPTLLKNNKVIKQSEFVTDLYSTPAYNEIDPNKVVFFFFMLFMGLIMADIGYGILMMAIGFFLASRIKVDNGTRRLWNVIGIGGIFTVICGILFNSFFGLSLLPITLIPSPVKDGVTDSNAIMILLLGSFGLGAIQIAVGYFCKALNAIKNGSVLDGICDGFVWVVFFIGLFFATFDFLMNYFKIEGAMNVPFFKAMQMPGLIITGVSLLVAALTAGRHEKGFGKATKGFSAIYGIISLLSDILSYSRLFGLMLSGMIIAQTFNSIGSGLFKYGAIGYILGIIIFIIGHGFNLAMNVLGAYIHDSRLQYIEFFSKFYTGEGEKFRPFGSKLNYVYLTNKI